MGRYQSRHELQMSTCTGNKNSLHYVVLTHTEYAHCFSTAGGGSLKILGQAPDLLVLLVIACIMNESAMVEPPTGNES